MTESVSGKFYRGPFKRNDVSRFPLYKTVINGSLETSLRTKDLSVEGSQLVYQSVSRSVRKSEESVLIPWSVTRGKGDSTVSFVRF